MNFEKELIEKIKKSENITLKEVREHAEGYHPKLAVINHHKDYPSLYPDKDKYDEDRVVVQCYNEGGYNMTQLDLIELLTKIKKEFPKLWNTI